MYRIIVYAGGARVAIGGNPGDATYLDRLIAGRDPEAVALFYLHSAPPSDSSSPDKKQPGQSRLSEPVITEAVG